MVQSAFDFRRRPYNIGRDNNTHPLQCAVLPSETGSVDGEIIQSAETIITNEWDKSAYVIYKPFGYWYDSFRFAVADSRNIAAANITLSNPVPASSNHMPLVFKNQ